MMTTKYPTNIMLMEAASHLETNSQWLDLQWVRRDKNVEADDLTNERFNRFDMKNRIDIVINEGRFPTLFKFMRRARDLYDEVEKRKAANKANKVNIHDMKKRKKTGEKKSW